MTKPGIEFVNALQEISILNKRVIEILGRLNDDLSNVNDGLEIKVEEFSYEELVIGVTGYADWWMLREELDQIEEIVGLNLLKIDWSVKGTLLLKFKTYLPKEEKDV